MMLPVRLWHFRQTTVLAALALLWRSCSVKVKGEMDTLPFMFWPLLLPVDPLVFETAVIAALTSAVAALLL